MKELARIIRLFRNIFCFYIRYISFTFTFATFIRTAGMSNCQDLKRFDGVCLNFSSQFEKIIINFQ